MRTVDEITSNRRMRRNRRFEWTRRLVRENSLNSGDLVWPIFVTEGNGLREPVRLLPGVERFSVDEAAKAARDAYDLGIPAIATFPNIAQEKRNRTGSEILDPDGLINQVTRAIKDKVPELGIITDVALDPFTSDGHDGIVRDGVIVNDETVGQISNAAIIQAEAGADIISCSEMMDGRVGAIRDALNGAGFNDIGIMSYTAKYASAFYGPYREAIGTDQMLKGDKSTYFMDTANSDEALHEAALDINEGADILMVKPGMPYLDIIRRIKDEFSMPTFAYQISGEYAMIMAGAEKGFLNEERAIMESLTCFKRAGADAIFTYFAPRAAEILQRQS
ncbi:MAG: porphobilinogen synthase [Hyphomicrobiales bacterium]|nr:porphobilinogen synthase [Hyphomicrobiales bacterium]